MADAVTDAEWTPWRVAAGSGFEVQDPAGALGLVQIDRKQFLVTRPFRFSNAEVETELVEKVQALGLSPEEARRAVDDARTFTPTTENPTDLASVPPFMRWFENSYGTHTLAAIIHDELIVDDANGGALRSDTLADRFFRQMMGAAGVPFLKRWIMWAAVALRSRWAAKGVRRVTLLVWGLLALAGITSFVLAVGTQLFDWDGLPDTWILVLVAVLLPFLSMPLWGKQYGASLVAAIGALWILPAAVFAAAGFGVYWVLEKLSRVAGLR